MKKGTAYLLFVSALFADFGLIAGAQSPPAPSAAAAAMSWRLVGPFRGGRVLAVAGVPGQPHTYYFGAAGGGVWKTTDDGLIWTPLFDQQPAQSIGAIAVAPSDPNVIYVGTGEADWRSDLSSGNGMYRSSDAGRTWQHLGLDDTRHIARINIDPANPNIASLLLWAMRTPPTATAASIGRAMAVEPGRKCCSRHRTLAPSTSSGSHRTRGSSMRRSGARAAPHGAGIRPSKGPAAASTSPSTAAPRGRDCRVRVFRQRSTAGSVLRSATVARGARVYALIDADKAGLYRSDDAGARLGARQHGSRESRGAPGISAEVIVDPHDADVVYAPNVGLNRSTDGGRTWTPIKGRSGRRRLPRAVDRSGRFGADDHRRRSGSDDQRGRRHRRGAPGTTSRPRSSTMWRWTTASRTASTGRSRTAAPLASRVEATTVRSRRGTGRPSAAARAVISCPIPTILTSSTAAIRMAACFDSSATPASRTRSYRALRRTSAQAAVMQPIDTRGRRQWPSP